MSSNLKFLLLYAAKVSFFHLLLIYYFLDILGESGEIYVQSRQKVVILDTTITEFKLKSEVDVKMKRADYISYINLGDQGAAVATTEGHPFFRLNVTGWLMSISPRI